MPAFIPPVAPSSSAVERSGPSHHTLGPGALAAMFFELPSSWMFAGGPDSDNPGGLNGSAQHWLGVHLQESTKLNSFEGVDVNGTLPCLGSD